MATPPMGGGNLGPNQPGGGGPANYGGPPGQSDLANLQSAIDKMGSNLAAWQDSITSVLERMEGVRDSAEGISDKLKDSVNSQDRMLSLLKQYSALQKDFSINLKNQKLSWKEVQDQAKKVLDFNKQLVESGRLSTSQANILKSTMKNVSNVFDEAAKGAKDFGGNIKVDADVMKRFGRELDEAVRGMGGLAANMGKVAQARLERHVQQLNKAFRDAGTSNKLLNFIEDQYAKAHALREMKAARQKQVTESREQHVERMRGVMGAAAKYMAPGAPMTPEIQAKVAALPYERWAKSMAYRGGEGMMGGVDALIRARAMRAQVRAGAGGAAPSWIERQAIKGAAAAGEGGTAIGGLAEGGLGAGLGVAAIGYSIFKIIEKFIDTRAQVNQGVERALGGALYTPDLTGTEAMRNVRENLRANIFNAFGQNLDRNLAIANIMQQQGFDVTELTRPGLRTRMLPGGRAPDVAEGFVGGVFGEFQRNVMIAGRAAGLTDEQTVTRMSKLMREMRQTFEATHDFLLSINVQARAAGISTTAYLKIVDDLTGQFDKMNKSFNESISLIQALGSAGAHSADDITDMATALTGAAEQKTVEQTAAAFTFMTKDDRDALARSLQQSVRESGSDLDKAIAAARVKTPFSTAGLDLNNPSDLMALQYALPKDMDPTVKQNLLKAAERKGLDIRRAHVGELIQQGKFAEAAIAQQALGGAGAAMGVSEQMALMNRLVPGGLQGLLRHPDEDITAAISAAGALGYKKEDIMTTLKGITDAAQNIADIRRTEIEGAPPAERTRRLKEYFEYGKRNGFFNPREVYDEKKMLAFMHDNVQWGKLIRDELAGNPGEMQDILHEVTKKGNEDQIKAQAKSVAMQTRTTADIYANAFEYLFTMLEKPIQYIADLIESMPFVHGKANKVTADNQRVWKDTSKNVEIAVQNLEERVAAGDKQAQADLSKLQATEEAMAQDPHNVKVEDYLSALAIAHKNSDKTIQDSTKAVADVLANVPTTESIADLAAQQPGLSQDALQQQYIRNVVSQAGGGQYAVTDEGGAIRLAKTLTDAQIDAFNKMAADQGLAASIAGKGASVQYLNITQNTTEAQAMLNAYPGLFTMKSTEGTTTGGGVVNQIGAGYVGFFGAPAVLR